MDTQTWDRVEAIFSDAIDMPPARRGAFLDRACGEDDELRREVDALLDVDEEDCALGVEDRLLHETSTGIIELSGLPAGHCVGPYRVEEEVGRGGMGTVYRARRVDGTFDKTVALKLVKRGMDTDEVLARFRRERQVLAGLDHPSVARLLDGGAADDGRPYLVMELVEGEPITSYCETHSLDIEARLALFEQVAEAVAHAHRRLVVHRDLKPSNILVAEDEHGQSQVKLLDFGIAKLLEPDADDVLTHTGSGMLTPAYAAPEQFRGEAVTTAADVYALGVILYELLTGSRPEVQDGAPLKLPSAVAATTRLRYLLHGDLDVITEKALREEPNARYFSVEALLDDLRRYRTGQPIQARRASVRYRMRKFVERHRVGVAATVLVALALVGGLGVALWQAQRANAAAVRAEAEAETAEQVKAYLVEVFSASNPWEEAGGAETTARELLDRGVERVEALEEEPDVQAELMDALGNVYASLGLREEAEGLLKQALATRQALHGEEHEEVAESLGSLAGLMLDRGDYAEAEQRYRDALAMRRRLLGDEHNDVAASLNDLSVTLINQDKLDEAEPLIRESLAIQRALHDEEHPTIAVTLANLAGVLRRQNDYAEAEALYREVLDVQRRLYEEDHPNMASTLGTLALVLRDQGNYEEAEPPLREALAMRQRLFGEEHDVVAGTRHQLGRLLLSTNQPGEAEPLFRQALEVSSAANGAQHWKTAVAQVGLGRALTALGQYEEAESHLVEAHALYQRGGIGGPPNGPVTAAEALADLYTAWGKPEQAAVYRAVVSAP